MDKNKPLTVEEVWDIFARNKERVENHEAQAPNDRLTYVDEEIIDECRSTVRLCVEFAQIKTVINSSEGYRAWHSLLKRLTKIGT